MAADAGDRDIDWGGSDPWSTPITTIEVYSAYFSCPHCRLVLSRAELIEQAGLPASFTVQRDYEPDDEPGYGND